MLRAGFFNTFNQASMDTGPPVHPSTSVGGPSQTAEVDIAWTWTGKKLSNYLQFKKPVTGLFLRSQKIMWLLEAWLSH